MRLTCNDGSRARRKSFEPVLAEDLSRSTGDRVRVTSSGPYVFLYAATESDARAAELAARDVLARHAASADVRIECWDLVVREWKDAEHANMGAAAHAFLQEQDRQWSARSGYAGWQVWVDLDSRHEAATLGKRLTGEGWPVIRRSTHLVIGTNCEDDACELAQEIREIVSADAAVSIKKTLRRWYGTFPPMPSG